MEIDTLDYAVLRCLQDANNALWKKRIYERVNAAAEDIPDISSVATQTIGRRVDNLHDEDLVTSCIVKSEELNRDLVIGYKVTEKGSEARKKHRRYLLQRYVKQAEDLVKDSALDEQKDIILSLLAREMDMPEELMEEVTESCSGKDLIALLKLYDTWDFLNTYADDNIVHLFQRILEQHSPATEERTEDPAECP